MTRAERAAWCLVPVPPAIAVAAWLLASEQAAWAGVSAITGVSLFASSFVAGGGSDWGRALRFVLASWGIASAIIGGAYWLGQKIDVAHDILLKTLIKVGAGAVAAAVFGLLYRRLLRRHP